MEELEQYVRDFNNGYLLAQYRPDIAASILKTDIREERSGLSEGIKQFNLEKERGKPSWVKSGNKGLDRNKDRGEKDIDFDRD